MNEQIKQLIKQAQVNDLAIDTNGDPYDVKRLDPEKFAELIVQECLTTVLKESKWYWDKDEFESSNAIQNAARRVKEKFGVEE